MGGGGAGEVEMRLSLRLVGNSLASFCKGGDKQTEAIADFLFCLSLTKPLSVEAVVPDLLVHQGPRMLSRH